MRISRIRLSDHLPPRLAPQSFQMAHFAYHSVQPTSFMKKAISPSFLGSPPAALMLTPKPQLQLAPNSPVHLMECPVAVPHSEIGAPPIQTGSASGSPHRLARSTETTEPLHARADDVAARFLAWPHTQHPTRRFTKLETQEREAFSQRRQPALLLIHHQVKSGELTLESLPRRPRLLLRVHQ